MLATGGSLLQVSHFKEQNAYIYIFKSLCSNYGRFSFFGRDRSVRLTGPVVLAADRSVLWTALFVFTQNRSVR